MRRASVVCDEVSTGPRENVLCFFASDLHGSVDRYRKLFALAREERPDAVFLGGDLLPPYIVAWQSPVPGKHDFVIDFLGAGFEVLRDDLGGDYPSVFLILGNDDLRSEEAATLDVAARGMWQYVHNRKESLNGFAVYGYAHVPPSPFLLKDWERYDVSRFVDPGAVSPEEGRRSVPREEREIRHSTIKDDLERLVGEDDLERAVFLFHSPPYKTNLDRAALDGRKVDHVPLDVHVGSIAIQRFIEDRQPLITLHGHVHESARLTGSWRDRIGKTHLFSAAHDGPELALVRFDPDDPESATRALY
ncbi:MAG: metallophosphoesterase [Candidatus Eisenbacteria bacterium]